MPIETGEKLFTSKSANNNFHLGVKQGIYEGPEDLSCYQPQDI